MKYGYLVTALALAAAPAAAAQEGQRPLSLDDAQRLAQEHNPAYRKVVAELATADSEVRRSVGALLPEISLNARSGGTYERRFTGLDAFGQPTVRDEAVLGRSSSASHSLSFGSLTLFDGGQRLTELRAARSSRVADVARVELEVLRLEGEVRRRYFGAVQAERAIRLEEALLEGARDRLESTQRLLRVGVRGPVDVLSAEVKVAEQEQALERARGEWRKADLALREHIGQMDGAPLRLSDEPPAPFAPAGIDVDALVAAAAAEHPRMQRAAAAERTAGLQVSAARAGRLPRLSMSADLGRSQRFQGMEGLTEISPVDQALSFSFSLAVPVFTGFRTSHQIQQARTRQVTAREDVRAERLALEREVRGAYVDLENAYRAARMAERTLELSAQRLSLAQEQYRIGALSLTELHDAVEGAARSERDALRARFEFADALATLEERVGSRLTPPAVRP